MNLYKLKDIANFQNGYAFSSNQMSFEGIPIIKIKEVKQNKILFSSLTQKTKADESLNKYVIHKNDILVALTGDPVNKGTQESWVGRTAIYNYDEIALLNQRMCKIIPNEDIILGKYLYYFMIFPKNLYKLASVAKGSANQANISHKDVGEMEIYLPNLNIQQHIVDTRRCCYES